jgi:hypothetical protein
VPGWPFLLTAAVIEVAMGHNPRTSALQTAAERLAAISDSRAVRTAVRFRWPILLLLTAAQVAVDANGITSDVTLFRIAGERLLSADWADTFADPDVQAGPLLLLFYGLLSHAAAEVGVSFELTLSIVVRIGLVWLVLGLVRRACRLLSLPQGEMRQLGAGLLLVVLDVPGICYLSGHPSEVLVVVLWAHAVFDVAGGSTWRAALWITVAALVVTQGAVGLVILFGARPLRRRVLVTAAAISALVTALAPFAVFGVVRTQDFVWTVSSNSLWGPILGGGHHFPWLARLGEGAAMGAVGVLAMRAHPPRNVGHWLVPATIVVARLLLDPTSFEYYWAGAQAMYVVGVATFDRRTWRRDLPFYLAGYPILLHGLAPSVYAAAVALVALGWALLRSGRRARREEAAGHPPLAAK